MARGVREVRESGGGWDGAFVHRRWERRRNDRRKRRRSELHYVEDEFHPSPKSIPAPFNTPDQFKQKRRQFQPMNGKQKRKKKSKRVKRKDCQSCEGPAADREYSIPRPTEYYNSKVEVSPLNFSDKNYTVNRFTETIFAGSIHRGYDKVSGVSKQHFEWSFKFIIFQDTSVPNETDSTTKTFVPWRIIFEEKMKNDN